MSRIQIFLFILFSAISLIFIVLNKTADFYISTHLSEILLFPVRHVSNFFQYLNVSQKKIDELETRLSEIQIENQNLKDSLRTLSLPEIILKKDLRLLKANIIGRDPLNFNGFLYIDKGRSDSLDINAPVILQDKLVGKIKALTTNTGIVETIENDGFAISAVDTRTGVYGVVKKKNQLTFEYVKVDDEINKGDSIYTSGLSEIFPKGIFVGTVAKINYSDDLFFKEVIITPALKINQLNYVYIIH
ncbi:MAG: rod shape-determining protein MreC [candidate division WOR-3 bacterium]